VLSRRRRAESSRAACEGAEAGVDHQRDVGQALAHQFQRIAAGDAFVPIGAAHITTLQPAAASRPKGLRCNREYFKNRLTGWRRFRPKRPRRLQRSLSAITSSLIQGVPNNPRAVVVTARALRGK
jgi:hypothetical protein